MPIRRVTISKEVGPRVFFSWLHRRQNVSLFPPDQEKCEFRLKMFFLLLSRFFTFSNFFHHMSFCAFELPSLQIFEATNFQSCRAFEFLSSRAFEILSFQAVELLSHRAFKPSSFQAIESLFLFKIKESTVVVNFVSY